MARRSGWYAKAEKTVPKLYSREVKPVGLVKVQPDAAAFQGWRALPAGELAQAWRRPLNPGDSLTLDFGEHLVGYWSGMAELGADTFWEVYVPSDQLANPYKTPLINSYCHAWSCAPAYFLRNAKFR